MYRNTADTPAEVKTIPFGFPAEKWSLRHLWAKAFCLSAIVRILLGKEELNTLAISKDDKVAILAVYDEVLSRAQGMVVTEYRGMTMKQISVVRKSLREVNGGYLITKNTLFKLALEKAGMAVPEELLTGPIAVSLAFGDLPSVTKAMMQSAKDNELIKLKGAIMGQLVFTAAQLDMVSTMPTINEARAGLIGTIVAPISSLLSLLEQPAVQLMAVLQAYSDKNKQPEDAAVEAA